MKKVIFTIVIGGLVTACVLGPTLPSQQTPEYAFYEKRCGSCHEAVPAESHFDYQWARLLELIARQWEEDHQQLHPPLSEEEKTRLQNYLQSYAKRQEQSSSDEQEMQQQVEQLQR